MKKYGLPEEEIFQTADLFERRNIPQVTLCLYALGRFVRSPTCKLYLHWILLKRDRNAFEVRVDVNAII